MTACATRSTYAIRNGSMCLPATTPNAAVWPTMRMHHQSRVTTGARSPRSRGAVLGSEIVVSRGLRHHETKAFTMLQRYVAMRRIPVAGTLVEARFLNSQCATCQAAASMPWADCHYGCAWFVASLDRPEACQWRNPGPAGVPTTAPATDPRGEAVSVTASVEVKSPTSPLTGPVQEWVDS